MSCEECRAFEELRTLLCLLRRQERLQERSQERHGLCGRQILRLPARK